MIGVGIQIVGDPAARAQIIHPEVAEFLVSLLKIVVINDPFDQGGDVVHAGDKPLDLAFDPVLIDVFPIVNISAAFDIVEIQSFCHMFLLLLS